MLRGSKTARPQDRLGKALRVGHYSEALKLYALLQECEPSAPRWPHRKGDLLLRMGRKPEAIEAYERAVELYVARGFVARAAAMAKVVIDIDSSRIDVLERVYPAALWNHRLPMKSPPMKHASKNPSEIVDEPTVKRRR